jgi:hypothetical protein
MSKTLKAKKGHFLTVDRSIVAKPDLSWTEWHLVEKMLFNIIDTANAVRILKKHGFTDKGIQKLKRVRTVINCQVGARAFGVVPKSIKIKE